jgi:hypothetical protein
MNIVEMIARSHNGQGLDLLAQQFGLDRRQTLEAVAELAPLVTAGVRQNTRQDDGLVSLLEALGGGRHERYMDDDDAVQFEHVRDDGNAILGHLFGGKQVSREVAMHASGSTGIGEAILKKMLPVIASMVLGAIFKQMTGGGRQPAPQPAPQPQGGGLDDLLRDILGGGQGQPAPQPRPQQRAPQPQGGSLEDLLRDILGGGMGAPRQTPQGGGYNDDAVRRGRETLDDIIAGDTRTRSGNPADDLLDSVRRRTGQR